jgi:RNA polymerase subunit RPABC4/transcription elongation factor Spt4
LAEPTKAKGIARRQIHLPGPTLGRLCPICDSPIEKGAKKCSFCGTDLTIFGSESEEALNQEERMVKESYETAPKLPPPAKSAPAPAAEPAKEEATFQCPNCNGMVKESDNVCPHCGAMFVADETSQFECPACNTLVDASATKCPGCGALFVEDTGAAPEATQPQAAPAPAPAAPPAAPVPADTSAPQPTVDETKAPAPAGGKDEDLERILDVTKRIKESRDAEAASKTSSDKKFKRPGLFRFGGRKEEAVEKPAPTPAARQQEPVVAPQPTLTAAPSMPVAAAPAPAAPAVKREFPTDPREQGKDLARLVAEVRALLGTATERDIFIDEAKDLLDRAITAGRERQFLQALEVITDAQEKLQTRLKDYVSATFTSMHEEIEIARRLGGDPSRADMFLNEASRASQTPDYQAALVFIDKAKSELSPITGRYNETKNALRKFERLVKDARVVGIDTEPLKVVLENAKSAFSALDFPKTEEMVKKSTDEVIAQIPDRMSKEIEKAKQMLVEAKMKSEAGVTPQITILKSAIKDMREEKYLEALSEMKKFKKEMKKILNPA